ncbi:hypothetical protein DF3PB_470014 [uncultured Defluviicoccus sp.]|uniref:Glucose/Sorbosone dehydrogenase domain-containing protein n=1 Tax=metagenome TaxID=256318 RepID=A0A380TIT3_9ZZZZ|nr:hypothetical protein DF3PB_470014 [uncultured Defluviicoccus sp.]
MTVATVIRNAGWVVCRLLGWVCVACLILLGAVIGWAQASEYRLEAAFPGITFNQPLGFASAPGETNRLFILEKTGQIQMVTGLSSTPVKQLFLDLSSRVETYSEGGVLGLAFHPDFSNNRYFYVFYTTNNGTGLHDRVSRFTALAGSPSNTDLLATEVPLISQYDEAPNHNGGDLHFGTDGYLYVALGDEGGADDQYNNSQRIDRDFFAGILRIDVDQRAGNLAPNPHPAVHPGTYRVPQDNPFVGAASFNGIAINPGSVRTEFWAVGLRNPWRFAFDAPTGRLLAGDVGQGAREEIDLITRGGNYGWNYREGLVAGPRSNPPAGGTFINPIWDADRATAGSITGGVVYRGNRFPAMVGRYIFGDYVRDRIFAMTFLPSGSVQVEIILSVDAPVAFGIDPRNGDILVASIAQGVIQRVLGTEAPSNPNPNPNPDPDPDPLPPSSSPPPSPPPPPPPPPTPVITNQPVPQTVTVGHDVTFSAAASDGNGRWQVSSDNGSTWTDVSNNGTYSGATTTRLTIAGAGTALSGLRYRYVATNDIGPTNSEAAMLTVAPLFFPLPTGLALDATGNYYVADSMTNTIHKITGAGVVSLLAGAVGQAGSADGTTGARFNHPTGVTVVPFGTVFVADSANATIRRIATDGTVGTFAGSPTVRGNADGTGTNATFAAPQGLAHDSTGNLYLADAANHTIRRISSAGAVTTVAGTAGVAGTADGLSAAARFNRPEGVAVDAWGVLYVADTRNNTIRRIGPEGMVTTLAGVPGVSGSDNGVGLAATFNEPAGIAVDPFGNLVVADAGNNAIRRVTPAGAVTTLAGLPTVAGHQDGTGLDVWFNHPRAVVSDPTGTIYVADTGNAAIRKISSQGQVTTVALTAAVSPPVPPSPPVNPPATPTPSPSTGGGGGAVSGWFVAALGLLCLLRWTIRSPLAGTGRDSGR